MISDEQRNNFEKWATSQQFCLGRFNSVDEYMNDNTHFAWEGWQAAQEVKPLEWAFLDRYQTWIARGFDYDYVIPVAGDCYHLYYGDDVLCSSNSIEGLKEAANADYKRRVLGCLVNGGV